MGLCAYVIMYLETDGWKPQDDIITDLVKRNLAMPERLRQKLGGRMNGPGKPGMAGEGGDAVEMGGEHRRFGEVFSWGGRGGKGGR